MAVDAETKRWARSAADEKAVAAGCRFDVRAAEKVREFFPKFLSHSKGEFAGKPFTLLDWQFEDIVGPLFGWKRPDGTRRFRKAFVFMPKKNGKSTLAAGLGLFLLAGDGERGAEVYSTGAAKEQAAIVHREAVNMVEASDALREQLRVNKSTNAIHLDRYASVYKALASEANLNEGLNAHALIIDELHAWSGNAGRRFYDALKFAGRARRQPMMIQITTAGDDETGVCFDQYIYAKSVLAGDVADQRYFAYVREASSSDDFDDEATWRKANPSMGVTINLEDFKADLEEAKKQPSTWRPFLRYSFNVWQTGGSDPAIDPEEWAACRADFKLEDLEGDECVSALDLSRKNDMTALALLFRNKATGVRRVVFFYWLPLDTIEAPNTLESVRTWAEAGFIRATDGNVTDYRKVREDIVEIFGRFGVQSVAFDPLFAEEMTQEIADETGVERMAFAQTMTNYAAASAEFERLVLGRLIEHDGNPVAAWNLANLRWKRDANDNRRPIKPSGPKKIDGIVAAIMCVGTDAATPIGSKEPEIHFI